MRDAGTPPPFLSVIIPCRNEVAFIGACLDSVVASDYPHNQLEVLVVDGESDDGTAAIVDERAGRDRRIRRVSNPKRITPAGLNAGIRAARGGVVVRMDAHARIETDYLSKCVEALDEYKADNVGGIMKTLPQVPGPVGDAIVQCLSHRFGVGNSVFRVHADRPTWVDTVFGGCYRREIFDRIGWFNERLARGQDMEFNLRLKKQGGRILLLPGIVSYYYARSDLGAFWRHNWNNGVWAILPFAKSDVIPVSWRHLVPLAFVSSVIGFGLLSTLSSLAVWRWCLTGVLTVYGAADLAASFDVARMAREMKYLVLMPWLFPSLHVAYGLGSVWGIGKLVLKAKKGDSTVISDPNPGGISHEELRALATRVRLHSVRMTQSARSSHVGSCLSAADLLAVLYGKILRINPSYPDWPDRDRFVQSKGHAAAALYAVLAERGFMPPAQLTAFCQNGSNLLGHVTRGAVPGVEVSTGSLGHGLSIACGMALAAKRDRHEYRVFCLLSDGECDEGSTWEAALLAAHHRLDNLVAIVDYNKIQSLSTVADVLELEPFAAKWQAFGWSAIEIDGHDIGAIDHTLSGIPLSEGRPTCLVAHTIKGKGVSFMEHTILWHYRSAQGEEFERAIAELGEPVR